MKATVVHRRRRYTVIECLMCTMCRFHKILALPTQAVQVWESGATVQEAFPWLSAPTREMMISGTHPECWNLLFADEED